MVLPGRRTTVRAIPPEPNAGRSQRPRRVQALSHPEGRVAATLSSCAAEAAPSNLVTHLSPPIRRSRGFDTPKRAEDELGFLPVLQVRGRLPPKWGAHAGGPWTGSEEPITAPACRRRQVVGRDQHAQPAHLPVSRSVGREQRRRAENPREQRPRGPCAEAHGRAANTKPSGRRRPTPRGETPATTSLARAAEGDAADARTPPEGSARRRP